jgi:hypothetical protein
MTDIPTIAKGLTEAQGEFLLWLPADGGWRRTTQRELDQWGLNALRGFGQSGLIDGYYQEVMRHRLTPLGLAVRDYLRENG